MWTLISWGFKHSRFDFVGNLSCAIITHKYGDINTTGSDIIPLLPTSKGGSEIPAPDGQTRSDLARYSTGEHHRNQGLATH
jgi:hypothetical protein